MKSEGLGDDVQKIIAKILYRKSKPKKCSPCERRRKKLNQLFPYKIKK